MKKKNETEILTPTDCPKNLANRLVALFCVKFYKNNNAYQLDFLFTQNTHSSWTSI